MAVLDVLEILVEADASGLETQLKRAGTNIQSFVSSMNKQEVDWTQILSRTISPAIIAGVAASFASMITQMMSFQSTTASVGASSTDSFASVNTGVGGSAEAMAELGNHVRQTASDMKVAEGIIDRAFGGTETADMLNVIAMAAGQLATEGIGSVTTNAQLLSNTLSVWGVKTGPEAQAALDGLNTAAKNGKIGILDLATIMENEGPKMAGSVNFSDAVISLNTWTTVAGQTVETAKNSFDAIGTAIQDQVIGKVNIMNKTVGNMGTIVKNSGMEGAFGDLAKYINANPTAAVNGLGSQMGLTEISMNADMKSVISGGIMPFITKVDEAKTHIETLTDSYHKFLDTAPWANFFNIMQNLALQMAQVVGGAFENMGKSIAIAVGAAPGLISALQDVSKSQDVAKGLNDQLKTSIGSKLTSSGLGFTSAQTSAIEKKAEQSDILPQLLHALTSGATSKDTSSSFFNTFQITAPAGAEKMTADSITQSLYKQFQGTK